LSGGLEAGSVDAHMGTFRIDIEVARAGRHSRWVSVTGVVVDSGAEVSWLPKSVLRDLGIGVFKKRETFVTADGRHVRRDVGIAVIRHGSFKTVDEVVFARPGDLSLLGARTLEGFNATVDARRRRLVAGGPVPAAAWAS
jgi:predicted aspartyl protease